MIKKHLANPMIRKYAVVMKRILHVLAVNLQKFVVHQEPTIGVAKNQKNAEILLKNALQPRNVTIRKQSVMMRQRKFAAALEITANAVKALNNAAHMEKINGVARQIHSVGIVKEDVIIQQNVMTGRHSASLKVVRHVVALEKLAALAAQMVIVAAQRPRTSGAAKLTVNVEKSPENVLMLRNVTMEKQNVMMEEKLAAVLEKTAANAVKMEKYAVMVQE